MKIPTKSLSYSEDGDLVVCKSRDFDVVVSKASLDLKRDSINIKRSSPDDEYIETEFSVEIPDDVEIEINFHSIGITHCGYISDLKDLSDKGEDSENPDIVDYQVHD